MKVKSITLKTTKQLIMRGMFSSDTPEAPTPVVTTFQTPSGSIIAYNEPIEVSSSSSNHHNENWSLDQARKKSFMDRIKVG